VLKKTITYTDFNGEEVSEDFFFHLSKAELVELELSHRDGLSAALERIVAAKDGKSIIAEFKKIILGAYGKRSDDGRRFIKNQEIRDEFESTEAYSTLFMELVTNTDSAVDFINGVIPAGMAEEAAKILEDRNKGEETEDKPELVPVPKPEPEVITRKQIMEMPPEELAEFGKRVQAGEVVITE